MYLWIYSNYNSQWIQYMCCRARSMRSWSVESNAHHHHIQPSYLKYCDDFKKKKTKKFSSSLVRIDFHSQKMRRVVSCVSDVPWTFKPTTHSARHSGEWSDQTRKPRMSKFPLENIESSKFKTKWIYHRSTLRLMSATRVAQSGAHQWVRSSDLGADCPMEPTPSLLRVNTVCLPEPWSFQVLRKWSMPREITHIRSLGLIWLLELQLGLSVARTLRGFQGSMVVRRPDVTTVLMWLIRGDEDSGCLGL